MFYQELFSQAWKYLWCNKLFWLYSALVVLSGLVVYLPGLNTPAFYCLFFLLALPLLALNLIGQVGLIHTTYLLAMNQQPVRSNTWAPLSSLGTILVLQVIAVLVAFILAVILFLFIAGYVAAFTTTTLQRGEGLAILSALLLIPVGSLVTFFYCSGVIQNMGVGRGIRYALDLIVRNLGTITLLNLALWGLMTLVRLLLLVGIDLVQVDYSFNLLSLFVQDTVGTGFTVFTVLFQLAMFLLTPYQYSVLSLAYVRLGEKDHYESEDTAQANC